MDRGFENAKLAALRRLTAARGAGQADPLAAPAMDALNAQSDWFTTSSCSGRVQVLALPGPGAKARARVPGRRHRAPEAGEVARAVARRGTLPAYFFLQPPIVHVVARDLGAARALLCAAQRAGFKGSHARSLAAPRGGA